MTSDLSQPEIFAKNFPTGIKKKGKDGKMYLVKNKKWIKLPHKKMIIKLIIIIFCVFVTGFFYTYFIPDVK